MHKAPGPRPRCLLVKEKKAPRSCRGWTVRWIRFGKDVTKR